MTHTVKIPTKKEFISKCCGAKLVGDGSRRYYSPHRLTILTPKCSQCHKPCDVEEKKRVAQVRLCKLGGFNES